MGNHISAALSEWSRLLGPEAVVLGRDLTTYTTNVTAYDRLVHAALRIRHRDQLCPVVAIARDHGVPLYPISTGHNWGLGSRLPVRGGAVVVDLSLMDHILALDRERGIVVVEPGVTQGQLAEHLVREAPELLANITGSAAATSMVGNTLDRGTGYLAPRTDDLAGLEILLGNGRFLRTGEWHKPGERYGPHWRHGIGPSLEGLFLQSNFGIVTAAAIRLRRRPGMTTVFRLTVDGPERIGGLLEALACLHRDSVLTHTTRLFDGVWTHGSLDSPQPAWTVFGGISGRPAVAKALCREVQLALAPLGHLDMASIDGTHAPDVPASESCWWRSVLSVMNGRPTDLSVTDWASRVGVAFGTNDLDASGFGMLCDVRIVPFTSSGGLEAAMLARETCAPYSLQPCICLSALDGHSLEATLILLFNRSSSQQVQTAHDCAAQLRKSLTAAGFVPHRVGVEDMPAFITPHEEYWQTVAAIKRSLDPELIIAPGRYNLL